MFVAIVDIQLKKESLDEFRKWFEESNKLLQDTEGFISRRLLESEDGDHRIIVEHKSKESFIKMHQSPIHQNLHKTAQTFFAESPKRKTYQVIVE